MVVSSATIDSLLKEREQYPPSAAFRKSAHLKDDTFRQDAAKDPGAFWSRMAKELDWIAPWSKVLEWNPPFAKWFLDGKLDRKSTRLNSSHVKISYAVFCLKKKNYPVSLTN